MLGMTYFDLFLEILLWDNTTATMSIINTVVNNFDLKKLCSIDSNGDHEGGEEVGDDPAAPALDLPVVVRSTYS